MSNLERLKIRVADQAAEVIRRLNQDGLLAERVSRSLQGEEQPSPMPQLSAHDTYWMDIVRFVGEIDESLAILAHAHHYLRFLPRYKTWKKAGITETSYLRYHVEHFLQEVYVLHERVDNFLDFLRSRQTDPEGTRRVTSVKKWFRKMVKPLLRVRGQHVHAWRFSDDTLDWLKLVDILKAAEGGSPLEPDLQMKILQLGVRDWRAKLRKFEGLVAAAVDKVCGAIEPLLFGELDRPGS